MFRSYLFAHSRISLLFPVGSLDHLRSVILALLFIALRDTDGVVITGVGQWADLLAAIDLVLRRLIVPGLFLLGSHFLLPAKVLGLLGDILILVFF
jgi:hypothetical protein